MRIISILNGDIEVFVPPVLTSDPTGIDGGIYYNSDTGCWRGYSDLVGEWQDIYCVGA